MAKLIKKDQGQLWTLDVPNDRIMHVRPYDNGTVSVTYKWSDEIKTVKCESITFD
jgi:hypothetical protein